MTFRAHFQMLTCLAVKGSLHLANFAIINIEQVLVQVLVQGLGTHLLQNVIQENIEKSILTGL